MDAGYSKGKDGGGLDTGKMMYLGHRNVSSWWGLTQV